MMCIWGHDMAVESNVAVKKNAILMEHAMREGEVVAFERKVLVGRRMTHLRKKFATDENGHS